MLLYLETCPLNASFTIYPTILLLVYVGLVLCASVPEGEALFEGILPPPKRKKKDDFTRGGNSCNFLFIYNFA